MKKRRKNAGCNSHLRDVFFFYYINIYIWKQRKKNWIVDIICVWNADKWYLAVSVFTHNSHSSFAICARQFLTRLNICTKYKKCKRFSYIYIYTVKLQRRKDRIGTLLIAQQWTNQQQQQQHKIKQKNLYQLIICINIDANRISI